MKKSLLIFVLTFSLVSCSNKDLDREKAENLIIEFYDYPNVGFLYLPLTRHGNIPNYYSQLVHDGYFTFKNERWRGIFYITNKSLPYLKDKRSELFISHEIDFNEITGIKFNDVKNQATVYYTTINKNLTPFAKSAGESEGEIQEKETHLELFDDGWRISDKKPKEIFKSSNYKVFDKNFLEQLDNESNKISQDGKSFDTKIINIDNRQVGNESGKIITDNNYKDKVAKIKVDNLNVRDKPSQTAHIIDQINSGEEYSLSGKKSKNKTEVTIKGQKINEFWYEVHLGEGIWGWIHGCCFDKKERFTNKDGYK